MDDRTLFKPCQACTCSLLRRASRQVTQHYEKAFRGTGLRATQFTLLATLIQAGPLPLSRLADMLRLERTTLTRNLGPLERQGYVESIADTDARIRRLKITPAGIKAARTGFKAWQRAQESVGDALEKAGLRVLSGHVELGDR